MRFITKAKHPAKSPPPKIVVLNDRYGLAPTLGWAPSNRSRTPPWTINTDRVRTAPMPNHHEKDLTAVLVGAANRGKAAPAGHSSGGVPCCQAESAVSTAFIDRPWMTRRRRPE